MSWGSKLKWAQERKKLKMSSGKLEARWRMPLIFNLRETDPPRPFLSVFFSYLFIFCLHVIWFVLLLNTYFSNIIFISYAVWLQTTVHTPLFYICHVLIICCMYLRCHENWYMLAAAGYHFLAFTKQMPHSFIIGLPAYSAVTEQRYLNLMNRQLK